MSFFVLWWSAFWALGFSGSSTRLPTSVLGILGIHFRTSGFWGSYRRRTIQLVGALCVNACSVACVKFMILACGFIFLDNQIRVAREAPRRLCRETPNRRFCLPTFEHVGAANLCRLKPLRRVHARLIYGPLLNLFVSGDRQPRPAAKPG